MTAQAPSLLDALVSAATDPAASDADRAVSLCALADRLEETGRLPAWPDGCQPADAACWEWAAWRLLRLSAFYEAAYGRLVSANVIHGQAVLSVSAEARFRRPTRGASWVWYGRMGWRRAPGVGALSPADGRVPPGRRMPGATPAVRRAVWAAARQALARALEVTP